MKVPVAVFRFAATPRLTAVGDGTANPLELGGVAEMAGPAVGDWVCGLGSRIGVAGSAFGLGEGRPSAPEMAVETERTTATATKTERAVKTELNRHPRMKMMIRVSYESETALNPRSAHRGGRIRTAHFGLVSDFVGLLSKVTVQGM